MSAKHDLIDHEKGSACTILVVNIFENSDYGHQNNYIRDLPNHDI